MCVTEIMFCIFKRLNKGMVKVENKLAKRQTTIFIILAIIQIIVEVTR